MADRPDDGPRGTLRYGEKTGAPARPDQGRSYDEGLRETLAQPDRAAVPPSQGQVRPRDLGTADTAYTDLGTAATASERDFAATPPTGSNLPRAATNTRAYADGVITTVSRQSVARDSVDAARAFQLPYKSSEVVGRLGSYDLLVELGRGAMGVVYKAFSLQLCRPCALKVMIPSERMTAVDIQRFQNEAMLAARLQHPHIVSVFDAGEDQGWFYIVMELVDGKPLTRLIDDGSEDAMMRGVRAIALAARALHYAHGKGIVHRDIKPDNILVDGDGNPRITDFGIAKSVEADDARMTMKGMLVGTPIYMSPEQANGEVAAIGPRSDLYSLGVTLYEMCSGEAPFESDNVYDIIARILTDEPPSPRDVARRKRDRDLPLDLEIICLKAIEKDAARRYQTGQALAEDIEAYLDDRPISARPISTAERLQKLVRRNRGMFVIAAVVFATLLVVGASFAGVMIATIQQTSASLRIQDEKAALDQANVLERSIRANMLQGRADVVRELVSALRKDSSVAGLEVVRTDRTLAYTDLATKRKVQRRLQDPEAVKRIREKFPDLAEKYPQIERGLEDVTGTAFPNIEKRKTETRLFDYDRAGWNHIVENVQTVVRSERQGNEPLITVLKPIVNDPQCQVCHGDEDDSSYGPNKVRAVLVVKRSQKEVERRIEENKRTTMMVGGGTAGII
ncbi:MAG TPA: serine/threonine-protein kinase, partial [Haliangium sp.]|nr:serine/threonine-protein kinase [Haliangium sp.]